MVIIEVLSTSDSDFFLSLILIILAIFILYYSYLFFKFKLYRDLATFIFHAKVFIYLLVLVLFFILLLREIVIFELTAGEEESSILWVIIISTLFGFYLSICFGALGMSKKWMKYLTLIFLIYISFNGFGYIGERVILNISLDLEIPFFFQEKVFESNTPQGVHFMYRNILLLLTIGALTFILEGEKRE